MPSPRVIESKQPGPGRPLVRGVAPGEGFGAAASCLSGALAMARLSLVAGLILALWGTSAWAQEPGPEVATPGQGVLDTNPFRFAKDPTRLDRWTPLEL